MFLHIWEISYWEISCLIWEVCPDCPLAIQLSVHFFKVVSNCGSCFPDVLSFPRGLLYNLDILLFLCYYLMLSWFPSLFFGFFGFFGFFDSCSCCSCCSSCCCLLLFVVPSTLVRAHFFTCTPQWKSGVYVHFVYWARVFVHVLMSDCFATYFTHNVTWLYTCPNLV